MTKMTIRHGLSADIPALLAIYNFYVANSHITFDLEPRTLEERIAWFAQFHRTGRYQCFVAVEGDRVIGWSSSSRFKDRAAYDTSIETSVYVAQGETGRGVGRKLYETLFGALSLEDVHRAYGSIATPNEASIRLHKTMHFRRAAAYQEVGRKFGRFWDVDVYERMMQPRASMGRVPLI